MNATLIHRDPDVYALSIPFMNISTSATNCYFIRDGNDLLVVDTGAKTDEGYQILSSALDELCDETTSISFFLTHFHLDHAGLVDSVIYPDSKLYVSAEEYRRTRLEMRVLRSEETYRIIKQTGASEEEASLGRRIRLDDGSFVGDEHTIALVEEGDYIVVGSFRLQVIDTSGHTSGHVSLLEPKSGIFIGGDHMLFVISPSIDLFKTEKTAFQTYIDNLTKLKSMPIRHFLVAHGDIKDDFVERIDWLLDHQNNRLAETYASIAAEPGLRGIEAIKSLKWNVPAGSWDGVSALQRVIIILQGLVLLAQLESEGRIVKELDNLGYYRYWLA